LENGGFRRDLEVVHLVSVFLRFEFHTQKKVTINKTTAGHVAFASVDLGRFQARFLLNPKNRNQEAKMSAHTKHDHDKTDGLDGHPSQFASTQEPGSMIRCRILP
jgi:hypothetical protein